VSSLRRIYVASKVDILQRFRALPTTFEDAIAKGKEVTTPGSLSSANPSAGIISTTKMG